MLLKMFLMFFLQLSNRECKKTLLNLRGQFQTMKVLLKKSNILVIVETVRQDRNVKYIFIKELRHSHMNYDREVRSQTPVWHSAVSKHVNYSSSFWPVGSLCVQETAPHVKRVTWINKNEPVLENYFCQDSKGRGRIHGI